MKKRIDCGVLKDANTKRANFLLSFMLKKHANTLLDFRIAH